MLYKALMVIGDVYYRLISAFGDKLDRIFLDKRFRELESRFDKWVAAGHIVISAVHIVVKYKADLGNFGIPVEPVFNAVARFAYPKILLAAIAQQSPAMPPPTTQRSVL